MRFSAVNQLHGSDVPSNVAKTFWIGEQQVGSLVRRGATGKPNRENVRIELLTGAALNFLKEVTFRVLMSLLDFFQGNADCVSEIVVVGTPPCQVLIEQLPERFRCPR